MEILADGRIKVSGRFVTGGVGELMIGEVADRCGDFREVWELYREQILHDPDWYVRSDRMKGGQDLGPIPYDPGYMGFYTARLHVHFGRTKRRMKIRATRPYMADPKMESIDKVVESIAHYIVSGEARPGVKPRETA